MVCSTDESAGDFAGLRAVRRLAEAIDRLEADRRMADSSDLEARIAEIWTMVCELDPQTARLASRYTDPPG